MRTLLLATVAAFGLTAVADAQTAGPNPPRNRTGETQNELVMNPNTRTQVRTYVTRQRVTAARLPSGFAVSVGATVPTDVELHSFSSDMTEVSRYRYFTYDDRTVLVEPGTRRVIAVVE